MPCDYSQYHPKWSLLRRLIQKRAGNKCERCGVENEVWGYWIKRFDKFMTVAEILVHFENTGVDVCDDIPVDKKPWQVLIGTAHLDHDVTNNRFSNLAFLCPVCHLRHDRPDNKMRRMYGPKGQHYQQLRIPFAPSQPNTISLLSEVSTG